MALYEILDSKKHIDERNRRISELEDLFSGKRKEEKPYVLSGFLSRGRSDPYVEIEKWVDECLYDIAENADLIFNEDRFVPLCVEYGIYGVHYTDKILGANVFFKDGQWYNEYLKTPIGSLEYPDLSKDETYQKSIRAAKRFALVGGKLPYFGLPTIASPLNVAVNLYGEEILVEMIEDPDGARHDLEVITDLQVKLHEDFKSIIPEDQIQPVVSWERTQPAGFGQLCGCTTQLLSKELYRDLVSDLDERLLGVYEHGGMIHFCGSHTQHIETFASMKTLRALQFNDRACADLKEYFEKLRDDQILYVNPCREMSAEEAIRITGGKRLVLVTRDKI